MCNDACLDFAKEYIKSNEVIGKRVIEVGSYDVNGSIRPIVEAYNPLRYLGVDIADGPGVDEICLAEHLVGRYGKDSFDVVISSEMIEHVREWRQIISNLKQILTPGGILVITTRSYGFPYHGYPDDYWRFSIEDARVIFSDMEIEAIESDSSAPGILVKLRKPMKFVENDLQDYALYSILRDEYCRNITNWDITKYKIMRTSLKMPIVPHLWAFFRRIYPNPKRKNHDYA